jgi:hypothetical protein
MTRSVSVPTTQRTSEEDALRGARVRETKAKLAKLAKLFGDESLALDDGDDDYAPPGRGRRRSPGRRDLRDLYMPDEGYIHADAHGAELERPIRHVTVPSPHAGRAGLAELSARRPREGLCVTRGRWSRTVLVQRGPLVFQA